MEKLADQLDSDDASNVVVARLDASKYSSVARRYGVRGFPTFKLFSAADDKVVDYKGGRTADAFSSWIASTDAAAEGASIPKGDAPSKPKSASKGASGGGSSGSRDVVTLTDSNFEHDTQAATGATTGTWFVAFVAPWCGHCKNLHPTWDKLAGEVKGVVNVARVDATAQKRTAQRFGVRAFPTLKLLHKGRVHDYNGARSLEALKEFALGGFKEAGEGAKVPPAPVTGAPTGAALAEALGLEELVGDLQGIARNHLGGGIVLASAAFTAGLLVMLAIAICTIPAPQAQAPPPPPAERPPAAAKHAFRRVPDEQEDGAADAGEDADANKKDQ